MKCSTVKHKIKYSINERNYKNYKSKIDRHQRRSPKQIKFNLSFEEFDKLTRLDCYYCGAKPSFLKRFKNDFKNREIEYFNGIDRIDSDKDYNLNNCVPCCTMCNRMKSDYNVSIFLKHIEQIYNFNKSSTTSAMHVASSDGETEGILTSNVEDYDIV